MARLRAGMVRAGHRERGDPDWRRYFRFTTDHEVIGVPYGERLL
ncbi:MAG TPA: hypothetical protein VEQ37_21300 [Actinomycetota bacterium]|nr:hypothetical protein [Actinomycetota bacterium]